ncbi:MAG: winged helix-turn-helix transcriptional regulator [Planctomycetales bacterium]|nr:winged helix-turn-helix transcriptional regulator [Planctomycetales bacterium]
MPLEHYDFEESVGYWIACANQAYGRAFQEKLTPYGITFRQAQVMGWLVIEGPMSQVELAGKMLIEPPSLVGIVDRMESAGLIERRACSSDRRKNLVHLLPASEQMWSQIAECARTMRTEATQGLSEEECATLRRLLKKVLDNVTVLQAT